MTTVCAWRYPGSKDDNVKMLGAPVVCMGYHQRTQVGAHALPIEGMLVRSGGVIGANGFKTGQSLGEELLW